MASNHDTLGAILRTDFHAFLKKAFETVHPGNKLDDNWHIELLCWMMTQSNARKFRRLILCLCPRSLKSFIVSVAFPAWYLGNDPTKGIICISYSDDLATKFSRDFHLIVRARWYRKAFPNTRFDKTKFTEREAATTKNGFRLATSVGGTLTGRGGDFIIIDDPIKAEDAMSEAERNRANNWFTSTVLSRFDNPNEGVLVIVSQRTHVDDLVGYVTERDDWVNVFVPAIATRREKIQIGDDKWITRERGEPMQPSRMDLESLKRQRRSMGSFHFEAQYQQNPMPAEGNLIKKAWFRTYSASVDQRDFDAIVQSWDTAASGGEQGSYSVCTTWGIREKRYYLLDVFRGRLNFPDLLTKARRHHHNRGAGLVLIEDASSGRSLLQSLHAETDVPVKPIPVDKDKVTRVAWVTSYIERGRVYLPDDAPWLGEFLKEILAFPNGKHDDQVDSLSQFLRWTMHIDQYRPPQVTVRLLGDSGVRDRYLERTGIPTFPPGF